MKETRSGNGAVHIEKCFDVLRELEKASILFKTEIKALSYEILKVYTFITEDEGSRRELSDEEAASFFESKKYEAEHCELTQAYDLVIRQEEELLPFDLELDLDQSRLCLVCSLDVYSKLFENLEKLHKKINAKKAFLGVIFKDFSPTLGDTSKMQAKLELAEDGLGQTKRILWERSEFYQPVVDASFVFTLQEEWELKNNQKLENSSYAARAESHIGKLIKCRHGRDGRNLLGKFVNVVKREPVSFEFGALDGDFLVEEQEECLIYKNLKDGFVGLNSSGLILIKDFSFEEINHRNMGNLLGGIECEFELRVKTNSADKDAVGSGIVLEAKTMRIDGGIDQGVILRSEQCVITGHMHQGVEIYADYAEISLHKGFLKCVKAKVNLCEGGKIECQEGEIGDIVGGEIHCNKAVIRNLRANNKIAFSEELEISNMVKGGNNLKIDSCAFYENRIRIENIQKRYQRYLHFIAQSSQVYRIEAEKIKQSSVAIKRFQEIFMQNLKMGLQTQPYIVNAIEQHVQVCEKLKQVQEKISEYQEIAQQIKAELEPIGQASLEAKLICRCAWVEQNQIEYFDLVRDAKETLLIEDGERVNVVIDPQTHKLIKERF